ncbi:MAG: zinc-ribbon domain-containing protein [Blastocatellia bacterium]|nr:zinc-ribbon domain-containing protein [Blastocatellia bacterium]
MAGELYSPSLTDTLIPNLELKTSGPPLPQSNPPEVFMFCPNCSAEAPPNQKFCRSCGLKLEPVT